MTGGTDRLGSCLKRRITQDMLAETRVEYMHASEGGAEKPCAIVLSIASRPPTVPWLIMD